MMWKKPDSNTPIVTFTPPPEEPVASSSFKYKPNLLTRKHLEKFNVRNNNQNIRPRTSFGDGDDGFESLNGNNSNGSDGENRTKDNQNRVPLPNTNEKKTDLDLNTPKVKTDEINIKADKQEPIDKKSNNVDSDGAAPTSSPSEGKRVGVRFRNTWIQEMIEHDSSDEATFINDKKEKVVNKH